MRKKGLVGLVALMLAGAPQAYAQRPAPLATPMKPGIWAPDQGDGTYLNPVLAGDYSDPDVVRVGEDYYLTASSFTNSPGLPILHSRDLVNWELVNHALPRHSIAAARVRVHLAHAPEPSGAWVERIDENHANAKRRWQALGAPEYLDGRAVAQLQEASGMVRGACPWTWHDGRLALEIELPPHAVAALTVEFAPS